MAVIQTYEDMKIKKLHCSPDPNYNLKCLADITQKRQEMAQYISSEIRDKYQPTDTKTLIPYLLKANHTSLFEHMYISFGIEGISRSLLAQITRHRMASYTVSSQHYQNYANYPTTINKDLYDKHFGSVADIFDKLDDAYQKLIIGGMPKEEARQLLPNAKCVNLVWTINARSLINFLNQRMCKRNVSEMRIFAEKIRTLAKIWWPTLFMLVGPDCKMKGGCTQGKMSVCTTPAWKGIVAEEPKDPKPWKGVESNEEAPKDIDCTWLKDAKRGMSIKRIKNENLATTADPEYVEKLKSTIIEESKVLACLDKTRIFMDQAGPSTSVCVSDFKADLEARQSKSLDLIQHTIRKLQRIGV